MSASLLQFHLLSDLNLTSQTFSPVTVNPAAGHGFCAAVPVTAFFQSQRTAEWSPVRAASCIRIYLGDISLLYSLTDQIALPF